jgi:hypothetical protein
LVGVDDDTVSVTVQEALPASEPPDRLRLPALNVAVPLVQVVAGLLPLRLAGSGEADTATPLSVDALGLLMVSVSVEVCDVVIEVGLKAAVMPGALGAAPGLHVKV